jgi:hypothetical protein
MERETVPLQQIQEEGLFVFVHKEENETNYSLLTAIV